MSSPNTREARTGDWRVLIVSGDAEWFARTEEAWKSLQPGWNCQHAGDPRQALKALSVYTFQAVVLDSKMPETVQLLDWIDQLLEDTVRVVRCEAQERSVFLEWQKGGVTAVADNIDAETLAASLKRTARLRVWLADPAMKALVPLLRKLPVVPKLHTQIAKELQSPTASIDAVAELIAQEPVMAAKMLQLVNSAFFGLGHEISQPAEAVMYLGAERVRALVLLASAFTQFGEVHCAGFSPDSVWQHSLQTSALARRIALAEAADVKAAESAFTAGLLHDLGHLMLAGNLASRYANARRVAAPDETAQLEAELKEFGTTHAELGAYLLGTWGLPLPMLEAVAWHHWPDRSEDTGFTALTAVHAANVFARELETGGQPNKAACKLNSVYLERIGLLSRVDAWRELCRDDAAG